MSKFFSFTGSSVDRFVNLEGEDVERVSMTVNNHDVQILRFNGNNDSLLVKVDDQIKQLPIESVDSFIRGKI